jgi:hypothetical protein
MRDAGTLARGVHSYSDRPRIYLSGRAHHRATARAAALPVGPVAVLSSGPRLASTLNGQGKNGEKWRFLEGQKRHFSLRRAGVSQHKSLIWLLLRRRAFFAPEGKKNVGRHFRARSFST